MPGITKKQIKKEQRRYVWAKVESIVSFLLVISLIIQLMAYVFARYVSKYNYVTMSFLLLIYLMSEGIDSQKKARSLKFNVSLMKIIKRIRENTDD